MLSFKVVSNSLQPHGLQPTRLFSPWGFFRQEYWSGLPSPPPGDLPNPGIEPTSLIISCIWQVEPLPLAPSGKPKLHTVKCNFTKVQNHLSLLPRCNSFLQYMWYYTFLYLIGNQNISLYKEKKRKTLILSS